jgi:hypothetical protein
MTLVPIQVYRPPFRWRCHQDTEVSSLGTLVFQEAKDRLRFSPKYNHQMLLWARM